MKSKLIFPYITDFVILTVAISLIFYSIFFMRSILYTSAYNEREITVITEPLPKELKESIRIGDAIYDNLTKERLGTVDSISIISDEESVRYEISFITSSEPRGDSLRTKDVWFRFYEVKL